MKHLRVDKLVTTYDTCNDSISPGTNSQINKK